jgi:hypothetical protein
LDAAIAASQYISKLHFEQSLPPLVVDLSAPFSSAVLITQAFSALRRSEQPISLVPVRSFIGELSDALADEDSAADLLKAATTDEMISFLKCVATLDLPTASLASLSSSLDARATALRLFSPRPSLQLTALLLAFHGKTFYRPRNLLWNVARNAGYVAGNASPEEIVRILGAFAKYEYSAPVFFRVVVDSGCGSGRRHPWISDASPAVVAGLIKCYSKLGLWSPRLNKAVEDRCKEMVAESGTPQDVATVAVAFSRLGKIPNLFRALQRDKTCRFLNEAVLPELIAVMWSLVTCGLAKEKEDLLADLWKAAVDKIGVDTKLPDWDINQLSQVALAAHVNSVTLAPLGQDKEDWLKEMLMKSKALRGRRADGSTKSVYEDVCSELLTEVGFVHRVSVNGFKNVVGSEWFGPAFDKMLLLDMADAEKMVAVEYDGNFHYLTNVEDESGRPHTGLVNGTTASKRRLLEQAGWTVVSVESKKIAAFYNLIVEGELGGDRAQVEKGRALYRQYLKTLMKEHL